jgi:hypothetical protein
VDPQDLEGWRLHVQVGEIASAASFTEEDLLMLEQHVHQLQVAMRRIIPHDNLLVRASQYVPVNSQLINVISALTLLTFVNSRDN